MQCAERDTISCTFADNGQCFFPLLLRYFRYFRDASFDWACGTTYVAARRDTNIKDILKQRKRRYGNIRERTGEVKII